MARHLKSGGSTSSVYLSEDDEEGIEMQPIRDDKEFKIVLGKRKKEEEILREVSDSEIEVRRSRKEKKRQDESEKIMEDMRKKREEKAKTTRKQLETEDSEMESDITKQEYSEKIARQSGSEMDFERIINNVQEKVRNILKAVGKEAAEKVHFSRADQQTVKDSATELLNDVIGVIMGQISLEKQVREMELDVIKKDDEIKGLHLKIRNMGRDMERRIMSEETDGSVREGTARKNEGRTYAEVSKRGVSEWKEVKKVRKGEIKGRIVKVGKEGWKTPPLAASRKGEEALVVSSNKETTARGLANTIAKVVSSKEIGGPPKVVRAIRDGRLVIVGKDKQQAEKIKSTLSKIEGVDVRNRQKQLPLLRVSGIEKGISDEELVNKIKQGGGLLDGEILKVIKRITCRNPWRENVILQAGVESFKKIVKRGKVEVDCVLYFVEEYMGISMCYRCCRFGHVMKSCRENEACHKCAGAHDGRDCKKKENKCINCRRMFGKEVNHSARDSVCPAFQKALERSRNSVNYYA